MNILVVGASGFIGSHFVEQVLLSTPWNLVAIDIAQDKLSEILESCLLPEYSDRFEFLQADYSLMDTLEEHVANADVVLSLASLCNPSQYNTIPLEVIESNYERPKKLVQMCFEHKKRLIHFSTSEVYGSTLHQEALQLQSENHTPYVLGPIQEQRWSYACAKQLLERCIFAYGQQGLDWCIIRPYNFIGPRMDYIPGFDGEGTPRVLACFMEALLKKQPLKIVDGGLHQRCFTAIEDAIEALLLILAKPEQSRREVFNIGNPHNETTIDHLADMMMELYSQNSQPTKEYISSEEFYGVGYGDSDRRFPDISKAQKQLGWEPKVPLRTALQKTINWFEKHYSKAYTHD